MKIQLASDLHLELLNFKPGLSYTASSSKDFMPTSARAKHKDVTQAYLRLRKLTQAK